MSALAAALSPPAQESLVPLVSTLLQGAGRAEEQMDVLSSLRRLLLEPFADQVLGLLPERLADESSADLLVRLAPALGRRLSEAVALARRLPTPAGQATALLVLAAQAPPPTRAAFEAEALAIAQAPGDPWARLIALTEIAPLLPAAQAAALLRTAAPTLFAVLGEEQGRSAFAWLAPALPADLVGQALALLEAQHPGADPFADLAALGAHLARRNLPFVVLEAGASVGASVRRWGHVRLFSPWRYNVDRAAALLAPTGWTAPAGRSRGRALRRGGHHFRWGGDQELGWSRVELTGAFSLALLVSGVVGVPAGRWLDRHGPRGLMTAGSLLAAGLVMAWAGVTERPAFYAI